MKFWIVTPSFNQVEWLKRAVASVADQATDGLEVHHHVQDGASTDGAAEWLEEYAAGDPSAGRPGYSFSFESVPDEGMYHAINSGWEKAPEEYDFIAYLNCDEQYLPSGLVSIARVFHGNTNADIILSTNIVVDGCGKYLCHRRAVKPFLWSARLWTASSACSTFMRRSVFFEKAIRFNTKWTIVGDMVWYVDMLAAKLNIQVSGLIPTVFFDAGGNLATTPKGLKELDVYKRECLGSVARFSELARQFNTFRRIVADIRLAKPNAYAVYVGGEKRKTFQVENPTNLWKRHG
jgi:glycosyltransferase involved in cell wall biosynthesis